MDAIVSGSANMAVLIDGNNRWTLKRTAAGVERALQTHDVGYVFGDASDLVFLEDIDEAVVLHELDVAHAGIKALHLALMSCDPETSDRAARLGAFELETLLARPEVAERAERILDAKPMPIPFDIRIAVKRCRTHQLTSATAFFEDLAARQSVISEVRRAWEVLPRALFESGEERVFADGLLAREGVFRSLVRALQQGMNLSKWVAGAVDRLAARHYRAERWLPSWVEGLGTIGIIEKALKASRFPALAARMTRFGGFAELKRWRMAKASRPNRIFPMP